MAGWAAVGQIAGEVGTALINSHSQHKANRTNIQLQREQQRWEEMMSNTAVQRRRIDIERAGGNPAAAFVNGSEASTPTVSPAQVQPVQIRPPNIGSALLTKAQLDNVQAQTHNTSADTRMKTIQADILEEFGGASSAQDVVRKTQENEKFQFELKKAMADADISAQTAKLLTEQKEAAIKLLQAQARMGELNAESSEAIARTLGVAGRDVGAVGKLFMEMVKMLLIGGKK